MRMLASIVQALVDLVGAIDPRTGRGSAFGAVVLLPLAGLAPAAVSVCNSNMVMVEDDCVSVTAVGAKNDDIGISIAKVKICAKDCWKIGGAQVRSYRESNGQEGYQAQGDISVRTFSGSTGPTPVKCMEISSVSNSPGDKGIRPDAWQVDIETDENDDKGNPITVSYNGDF